MKGVGTHLKFLTNGNVLIKCRNGKDYWPSDISLATSAWYIQPVKTLSPLLSSKSFLYKNDRSLHVLLTYQARLDGRDAFFSSMSTEVVSSHAEISPANEPSKKRIWIRFVFCQLHRALSRNDFKSLRSNFYTPLMLIASFATKA